MERASRVLTSTGFLFGLAVLLVNDLVLKLAYPSLLTGKLSDFAGLFIFPMFFAALIPRHTRPIYVATAIAFVWWKSPLSQAFIDNWNETPLYDIARVVDYTDLVALAVLPISLAYITHGCSSSVAQVRQRAMPVAFIVAALAFGATSSPEPLYEYPDDGRVIEETLPISFQDFPARLDETGLWHSSVGNANGVDTYNVELEPDCPTARFYASAAGGNSTLISLVELYGCDEEERDELESLFRDSLLARLKGEVPAFSLAEARKGDRLEYAVEEQPILPFASTMADARHQLDRVWFGHRFEEDIYEGRVQWGCYVHYKLETAPDGSVSVRIVGFIQHCERDRTAEQLLATFTESLQRSAFDELPPSPPAAFCLPPINPGEPTPASPPELENLIDPCPTTTP
jgi:hypothetical protein